MKKPEIDHILAKMLDSHNNVSDLNITVGKPFQVESSGQLVPVDIDLPLMNLPRFRVKYLPLTSSIRIAGLPKSSLTRGPAIRLTNFPARRVSG